MNTLMCMIVCDYCPMRWTWIGNMLVLPLKPSVRYDLSSALASWLDDPEAQVAFVPTNPLQFVVPKPDFSAVACKQDLMRLQSLRNCLCDIFLKPGSHKHAIDENGLDDCFEYHAALLEFEKRGFPTLDDDSNGIRLQWKGAFGAMKLEKHGSLIWDRACIIYNIVSLLTDKVADCTLTDRDACKQAVGHCQMGATLFNMLKELVQSQDFSTVDLSVALLDFWERYMLAQAQTLVYRMVSLAADSDSKHATLSFLSRSSYLLFADAILASQDPRLQSEVGDHATDWGGYCKAVSMLQAAKAAYHQSVVHRIAGQWGLEIGRLRECLAKLESCRDFCKTVDPDGVVGYTKRECQAILPVVRDRLHEADADNFKLYHDEIPKELPEIPAKQLAKLNSSLPETMLIPRRPIFVGL